MKTPSPLVGEGRGPLPEAAGRVRGNAEGLTKRQQLSPGTVARSRELRKAAGEPERRLWRARRAAVPEAKFRRQVPLGRYHADFCSHAAKLVVEIDGDDHATRATHDAERTRFLQREGYQVLRFANAEVTGNTDGVLAAIVTTLADRQKGRP